MKCLARFSYLQQKTDQGDIDLILVLDVSCPEALLPKLVLNSFDGLHGLLVGSERLIVAGQGFECLTFSILELPDQLGIAGNFSDVLSGSIMLEGHLKLTALPC